MITETGGHDELLEKGRQYYRLYMEGMREQVNDKEIYSKEQNIKSRRESIMSDVKKITAEKNNLRICSVLQKTSLVVFFVVTAWLLVKTAQLYAMYFSKDLFSAAEWSGAHRYPDYAKYLFAVQIISLIILVVTSRAKKRNGMSK